MVQTSNPTDVCSEKSCWQYCVLTKLFWLPRCSSASNDHQFGKILESSYLGEIPQRFWPFPPSDEHETNGTRFSQITTFMCRCPQLRMLWRSTIPSGTRWWMAMLTAAMHLGSEDGDLVFFILMWPSDQVTAFFVWWNWYLMLFFVSEANVWLFCEHFHHELLFGVTKTLFVQLALHLSFGLARTAMLRPPSGTPFGLMPSTFATRKCWISWMCFQSDYTSRVLARNSWLEPFIIVYQVKKPITLLISHATYCQFGTWKSSTEMSKLSKIYSFWWRFWGELFIQLLI